jgi:hypothetical protein
MRWSEVKCTYRSPPAVFRSFNRFLGFHLFTNGISFVILPPAAAPVAAINPLMDERERARPPLQYNYTPAIEDFNPDPTGRVGERSDWNGSFNSEGKLERLN